MSIKDKLAKIADTLEKKLAQSPSAEKAAQIRNSLINKELNALFPALAKLPANKKSEVGQQINATKSLINQKIDSYLTGLQDQDKTHATQATFDLTAPGIKREIGSLHPVTQILDLVAEAFGELGFSVVEGPNIETDYYCFEALNMPPEHPARDMQDSFYLDRDLRIVPRTHTSSVQIRHMLENKPPIKIIVPGRCYRNEKITDRHFIEFYQFEGLVIDEHTTVADLKGTIELAMRKVMEDPGLEVRFRHAFFPYTEPSFEIDFSCPECGGSGVPKNQTKSKKGKCRLCDGKGWLEIGGLGMVHPQVLKNVNIDPDKYQGFAFGWGPGRLAMIKHGIPNFRHFWNADLRFLKQF